MVITKAISRFARNTVTLLETVRELKSIGVDVFFEKENIYTLDSKGELLISIMSSLAQEESRSISENVSWGQRKRFADGKVSLPYKHFLGYEKGEDGIPKIVENEAVVIRLIYKLFLEGKMPSTIARYLTQQNIPSPAGKTNWQPSSVESILTNEKYKGDAILQKTFCVDFLTKKMKVNEGEIPQYYVENSHPAIIAPEIFDLVQHELNKRKTAGYSSKGGCFSSRIICGECGAFYGSKVWHSTDQYRRTVWQCNRKFKNEERCQTPHIEEETIKSAFINVMNRMIDNKDSVIGDYRNIINMLTDTTVLDDEEVKLKTESQVTLELIRKKLNENARSVLDQEDYQRGYDELVTRYETVKTKLNHISEQRLERSARREKLTEAITMLEQQDGLLDGFNESLWNATVESVIVKSKDEMMFTFKDGTTVR